MKKINYGIDAPALIRNMYIVGFILLLGPLVPANAFTPVSEFLHYSTLAPALSFLISSSLMVAYSVFGKTKHRDRILNLYNWKGNEKVLDVGTGSGLLMIGAAKKLTTGKSFGVDIFNSYDLSDNTIEQTRNNIALENVADKTEIVTENIMKTNFSDNYFDVIISNLCIHNLYKKEERILACKEINRILKSGGKAIISDFKKTSEYKSTFESLGMNVTKEGTYFFSTFPPLTIIIATKK